MKLSPKTQLVLLLAAVAVFAAGALYLALSYDTGGTSRPTALKPPAARDVEAYGDGTVKRGRYAGRYLAFPVPKGTGKVNQTADTNVETVRFTTNGTGIRVMTEPTTPGIGLPTLISNYRAAGAQVKRINTGVSGPAYLVAQGSGKATTVVLMDIYDGRLVFVEGTGRRGAAASLVRRLTRQLEVAKRFSAKKRGN